MPNAFTVPNGVGTECPNGFRHRHKMKYGKSLSGDPYEFGTGQMVIIALQPFGDGANVVACVRCRSVWRIEPQPHSTRAPQNICDDPDCLDDTPHGRH